MGTPNPLSQIPSPPPASLSRTGRLRQAREGTGAMTNRERTDGAGENVSLASLGRDRAAFIPDSFYDDGSA